MIDEPQMTNIWRGEADTIIHIHVLYFSIFCEHHLIQRIFFNRSDFLLGGNDGIWYVNLSRVRLKSFGCVFFFLVLYIAFTLIMNCLADQKKKKENSFYTTYESCMYINITVYSSTPLFDLCSRIFSMCSNIM